MGTKSDRDAAAGRKAGVTPKPSRPANPLVETMAASAGVEDIDRFADEFAARKNGEHAEAFARVPYGRRILLVPQCLRASGACAAEQKGPFYECARCGACAIDRIIDEAERLGYMGVHILKGGRAVAQLIERYSPGAVAGVACNYEGIIGIIECERRGIPVQFVALTRDGCADTEVDFEHLKSFLARLDPGDDT
jgi:hypothetical protein